MYLHDVPTQAKNYSSRRQGKKKRWGEKKKKEKKIYEEKIPVVIRYITVIVTYNVAYPSSCH